MVMYSSNFTYECVFYYVLGQRWLNKQVKSVYERVETTSMEYGSTKYLV